MFKASKKVGNAVMLELVPISNDNSCTAKIHSREASEAFNSGSVGSTAGMEYNKIYPATSGYQKPLKNIKRKTPKKQKSASISISGQQLLGWLGGATLVIAVAIGFKTYQASPSSAAITVVIAQK